MYHFVFNVVVVGALAFIILHDGGINLPTDFLRDRFAPSAAAQQETARPAAAPVSVAAVSAAPATPGHAERQPAPGSESKPAVRDSATVPADAPAEQAGPVAEEAVPAEVPAAASVADAAPPEPPAAPETANAAPPKQRDRQQVDNGQPPLPPIAPAVTVATMSPKAVPAPAAQPAGPAPSAAAPAQQAFMAPGDRRRELDRMIGELENFYLDRVTR